MNTDSLKRIADIATQQFVKGKGFTKLTILGNLPEGFPQHRTRVQNGIAETYTFGTKELLEWLHENKVIEYTWQEIRKEMYAFNKQAQRLLGARLGLDNE